MNNETVYTAPTPSPPPAAPQQPALPPKIRRVGTFTMGISLIAAGGLAIYSLINPAADYVLLFRFTPVILILLGIEIMISAIFAGGTKLKYDFLSMVVCTLLICGTLCLAALPHIYRYWGPEREYIENRLEGDLYDLCYEQLGPQSPVKTLAVSINVRTQTLNEGTTLSDLNTGDNIYANIELKKEYPSAIAFAEDCSAIASKLSRIGVVFQHITFSSHGNPRYYLELQGRYLLDAPAGELVQFVDAQTEDVDDPLPEEEVYDGEDNLEESDSVTEESSAQDVPVSSQSQESSIDPNISDAQGTAAA